MVSVPQARLLPLASATQFSMPSGLAASWDRIACPRASEGSGSGLDWLLPACVPGRAGARPPTSQCGSAGSPLGVLVMVMSSFIYAQTNDTKPPDGGTSSSIRRNLRLPHRPRSRTHKRSIN